MKPPSVVWSKKPVFGLLAWFFSSFSCQATLLLATLFVFPAAAADLTLGAYTLQSSRRISPTEVELVYRATVINAGAALTNVQGAAVSNSASTVLLKSTLRFGDVAAQSSALSLDTFTVRQRGTQPFGPNSLRWTLTGSPAKPFEADFTYSPASGNAPVDVRFTPAQISSAVVERFDWDLNGDGTIDVSETVGRAQSFRYAVPGTYAVTLKITDALGRSDTRVRQVVIGNAPPVVTVAASPSNGPIPLNVSFTASATDNEGVARFEWDFDGDGTFDRVINSTNGNTTYTYGTVGRYVPRLRVSDRLGASVVVAVPTMEVVAAPAGSPVVTLSLSRRSGAAPLSTTLTATSSPAGAVRYEWDLNGDGSFDATTTSRTYDHIYNSGGTFYPRVRVTLGNGNAGEDAEVVTVGTTVALSLNSDTLDPALGQTVTVTSILSAPTRASIVIENRSGRLVRTLVPMTLRNAGSYSDVWDGKGSNAQPVADGVYSAVLLYEINGTLQRYDLSSVTGGAQSIPERTELPTNFQPFNNAPLTVDFTLTRAAEVTAFIGSFQVNARYITFFTRRPFGRGTHRVIWHGDGPDGQLIQPAPGDSFLFGQFAFSLPDNAIYVRSGVQLTAVTSAPPIFDPTSTGAGGQANRLSIRFSLTQPASVELAVQDTASGVVVRRLSYQNLPSGENTVLWDGKAGDGRFVAPGSYRLALTAVQDNGFRSLTGITLQRVFY